MIAPLSASLSAVKDIKFYNRYTGAMETEQVYGEGFLQWAYGNPLGKIALHSFVKRPFFSKWYGRRMDQPASQCKVLPFIDDYQMDAAEFADAPESYSTFNEFFYRKLRETARPVANSPIVFPADGRHLGFPNIDEIDGFFVKGQKFDLDALLDNEADELELRRVLNHENGEAVKAVWSRYSQVSDLLSSGQHVYERELHVSHQEDIQIESSEHFLDIDISAQITQSIDDIDSVEEQEVSGDEGSDHSSETSVAA